MTDELTPDLRDRLLDAALPHVPFDGWTAAALARAAADLGLAPESALRAFPRGGLDMVDWWVRRADAGMAAALAGRDLAAMKIRERIALAVRLRLEAVADQKEAVRRALALELQPFAAPAAMRQVYRTVDAMWYGIGDTSTDFSFYTKRLLLAGVYSATLLFWLNDRSEGAVETWAFLDRRIADVMRIQTARSRLQGMPLRLPDPRRILRRAEQPIR